MERRYFLQAMAGAAATAVMARTSLGAEGTSAARQPNVLLIIADDQGWGDIHSHGNEKIDTPVLDRLADQGARFDRFFVCPLCAPTRAALLTGRYHLRAGVSGVTRGYEVMRSEEVTLAEALKQAGYATGIFGKWHNGAHFPYHPNGQGFDEFIGFCGGHWNNYFDTTLEHNGEPLKTKGFITDVLTDAAMAFIEKNRERPFFCYVPYNAPHGPFQVPDRYFDKYKKRGLDDKDACIYGMVESVDDNVGRLLKKLDEEKLAENTIVLFLTDNGPNGARYNGGMRGTKGSVDEGGVRAPFFIRWPGGIKPGTTVKPIAANIDLFPTILELCGVAMPKGVPSGTGWQPVLPLDGVSLAPLLKGQTGDWPDRMIFFSQLRNASLASPPGAVRTQQYRLVTRKKGYELYDMIADPGQEKDIARERPEVVKRLSAAYEAWLAGAIKGGLDRLPIPVGYAEAPLVEMPAPECYMEGSVAYKGKAGYANDWITGWQNTDDRVWWDVDVVRAGKYEVTLMYTCPESDVGARIRVEAGGNSVEGTLTRAHDPAPVPSPDRVPRGEVYEKVWAPLTLGTLALEKGRTNLTVKALTRPGKAVMELKALRLRRVE